MSLSRRRLDLLVSTCLLLLGAWVVWEARDWPFRVKLFPWVIGFPVLALTVVQLARAWRHARRGSGPTLPVVAEEARQTGDQVPLPLGPGDGLRVAAIVGWVILFGLGLWLLGFRLGSPLLMLAFLRLGARESVRTSLVFSLAAYLFFLMAFETLLAVPLPPGQLAESLGFEWPDTAFTEWIRQGFSGG